MINHALQFAFALAWDVMLVGIVVSAIALTLVLIGDRRRERFHRTVDDLLTRGDTHAAREELRANARLYPARRAVMGVHKEAPGRERTVPGAKTHRGEVDEHRPF